MQFDPSILDNSGTVLIDDRDASGGSGCTYVFHDPERVIVALSPDEVIGALEDVDRCIESGMYVAGFIGYEAGLVLDKPIEPRHKCKLPLIWLGVYRDCLKLDAEQIALGDGSAVDSVSDIRLNISEDEYISSVCAIQDYIAAGDVYQVNYTCKLLFEHSAPARELFARLRAMHPVGYSAFVNLGDAQIISLSPELFLRREGNRVLTRPMKGTASRGRWFEEDEQIAQSLALDEKNRAENLMILDLMRNDIGRISEIGGVSVPRMFHVDRYASLFQMISDVEGHLRDGMSASKLLTAVFPPGSITGAPKIRAMEIINELEHEAREVYCGCIGMFEPGCDCLLNVAIRTIVQRGNTCEMGVGSGIVADSDPKAELQETLLKGAFVESEPLDFRLLETLLYEPGEGYVFLNEHLTRMAHSAEYFGWQFDKARVMVELDRVAAEIGEKQARVRLLVSKDGMVEAQWNDIGAAAGGPVSLLLASRQTDPEDVFLYHKTTHRKAYDEDFRNAQQSGFRDVLYLNTRGELTECAITNIMLEIDGHLFTPPLNCGLLPGIWRASVIAHGKATERVLTLDDLERATRIIIGNSVRGEIEVDSVISEDGHVIWRKQ